MIRTPDQRLRVFVSSTITELADERAAVARAVSGMGMTPVLFELGARPHAPRDLYRRGGHGARGRLGGVRRRQFLTAPPVVGATVTSRALRATRCGLDPSAPMTMTSPNCE